MPHGTPERRLVALLALALVPWTAIVAGDGLTLLFPAGHLDTDPLRFVDYATLLSRGWRLPRNPELLPASVLLYLAALVSAAAGLAGREDGRLTGGLLVLAGLAHLGVGLSVLHRLRYTPVPVGVVLVFAVAWWFYWPDLRAVLVAPGAD